MKYFLENKIKFKIFYFRTYAEVLTMGRKIKYRIKYMGGVNVFLIALHTWCFFLLKSLTGGGKCPEEEHTTCSGGPTNYNLSQARFTGRENIL